VTALSSPDSAAVPRARSSRTQHFLEHLRRLLPADERDAAQLSIAKLHRRCCKRLRFLGRLRLRCRQPESTLLTGTCVATASAGSKRRLSSKLASGPTHPS
jgi:hypothetical protein